MNKCSCPVYRDSLPVEQNEIVKLLKLFMGLLICVPGAAQRKLKVQLKLYLQCTDTVRFKIGK